MLGIDLSVAAHGRVAWAELVELLALPPAEGFPLPLRGSNLGTTSVDVFLDVRMSGLVAKDYGLQEKDVLVPTAGAGMPATGGTTAKAMLRFVAEHRFPKPPELWGFALGPLVRLEFFAIFADEAAASAALSTAEPGKKLDVIIRAEVSARLPPLPELSFLSLRSGDTSGLVTLRVEARAGTDATFGLSAEVVNLAMLDIAIPGLSQDGPALSLALASVRAELSVTVSEGGGTMTTLEAKGLGRAHFRPRVDVDAPSTAPLAALFASAGEQDLTLDADATLTLRGTLAKQNNLILDCELEGARVALDVYPVVARLLQGVASPPRAASPADVDCTPRATFGFVLRGFTVGFAGEPWFDLRAAAIALGVEIPGYLRLSTRELRFGLGSPDPEGHVAVRLPLRFPQVTRREFDTVVAPFVQRVRTTSPGDPDDPRTRYLQLLDLYFTLIEATTVAVPGTGAGLLVGVQDASGTWSVRLRDPTLPEDDLPLRLASGTTRKRDLQGELQDTGDLLIALRAEGVWIPLVVDPCLVVKDFAVALSLRGGSRGPSWSGTAAIGGFVGPLAELEKVSLTLGISADLLYFSLDVRGGVTVTVPPLFPGWESGTITVAKAMFGFGYPKRSLAFAFAGELCLPSQLVDALDTSGETTTAGLGVRLPAQSKLAFQFELMPIVIGKVIIPLPMFTFAWDLRKDGAPGIVSTKGCEPSWDGLQLILAPPGGPVLQRYSLELISYCPLLGGLLACSNSRFQGDIQLGSPTDGLTVIVDDLFWAYGIDNQLSLALAPINEVPFFRNVCVNVRMAGFGLRFDLQRPIPTFSPLAIFEALGLLADPLEYQVAPRGELADMVRATLQDAAITLPAEVLALFPDASEALRRELEWTINLGTLIRLVQVVARVAKPLAAEGWHALSEARAPDEFAAKLLAAAPRPDPRKLAAELLDALPPALRRVSLRARFGELDAEVTLILADLDAVRLDLARAVSPQPSPGPSTAVPTEHWSGRVRFRPSPDALPSLDGPGAGAQLLFGAEVDGVSLDDVEAAAAGPVHGLFFVARLALLSEKDVRFLGFLSGSGGFYAVTFADLPTLAARVRHLEVPIPLQIQGRLTLFGRTRTDGVGATLRGQARGAWHPIPGLSATLGSSEGPVTLTVSSRAQFSVRGPVSMTLFDPAITVSGDLDVDENRALLVGKLFGKLGVDPVPFRFGLVGRGEVGPGSSFSFGGEGVGRAFGITASVRGRVTERRALLQVDVNDAQWPFGWGPPASGQTGPAVSLQLRADVELGASEPVVLLGEGSLVWETLGLTLNGRATLTSAHGAPSLVVEGALQFMGRAWTRGRVELGRGVVQVSGATRLDLSSEVDPPESAPLRVLLRADVSGSFAFGSGAVLTQADLELGWMVGVRLPKQLELPGDETGISRPAVVPIAAGDCTVRWSAGAASTELVKIRDLPLLPSAPLSLTIPAPDIRSAGAPWGTPTTSGGGGVVDLPFPRIPPIRVGIKWDDAQKCIAADVSSD